MLGKLIEKQKAHMEQSKTKIKSRQDKIEEARIKGLNKIDNAYETFCDKLGDVPEAPKPVLNSTRSIKEDKAPCCPKCSSEHITAQKQGFGVGKAVAGVVVAGPIGAVAGGINKNKIQLTCLKCGNKFKIK